MYLNVIIMVFLVTVSGVHSLFGFGSDSLEADAIEEYKEYGVDVSFPIHHYLNPKSVNPTKRHFANRYKSFIEGCHKAYSARECDSNERARIDMNLNQPRSQHNYTDIGFKKMRIPQELWSAIQEFWDENKDKERIENWPRGNSYVNHWESPSYMVSTGERSLRLNKPIHNQIVDTMKEVLGLWTGKPLEYSSLYGIRVYKRGAILATHVDRLPLVSSAILQVAQDLDEPWPVEVYSHDGTAHNVTMEPGDMVLYESHSVLHGRPHPLNGRLYANIFVHFIPTDHEESNERDRKVGKAIHIPETADWAAAARKQRQKVPKAGKNEVGHEAQNHDDEELKRRLADHKEIEGQTALHEELKRRMDADHKEIEGQTALHRAASLGQLDLVETLLSQSQALLHARDANDWQAIHEAARSGQLDTLKYLVDMGADFGARTSNGGTPLFWARSKLPARHPVIVYLEAIGAPDSEDGAPSE